MIAYTIDTKSQTIYSRMAGFVDLVDVGRYVAELHHDRCYNPMYNRLIRIYDIAGPFDRSIRDQIAAIWENVSISSSQTCWAIVCNRISEIRIRTLLCGSLMLGRCVRFFHDESSAKTWLSSCK